MPDAQPNYLTTDAEGKVGAEFSGHIGAAGVDLIAYSGFGIPENVLKESSITWHRNSLNGPMVARITTEGSPSFRTIVQNPVSGRQSFLTIDQSDGSLGGNPNNAFTRIFSSVEDKSATILNAAGESNFFQWATPARLKASPVTVLNYPAIASAGEYGFNVGIPWTTNVYVIGSLAGVGGLGAAGPQLCSWSWWPYAAGAVQLVVRNNSPYGMGQGGSIIYFAFYL